MKQKGILFLHSMVMMVLLLVNATMVPSVAAERGWKAGDVFTWNVEWTSNSNSVSKKDPELKNSYDSKWNRQQSIKVKSINETAMTYNFTYISGSGSEIREQRAGYDMEKLGELIARPFIINFQLKDQDTFVVSSVSPRISSGLSSYFDIPRLIDPRWDLLTYHFKKSWDDSEVLESIFYPIPNSTADLLIVITVKEFEGNASSIRFMGQDSISAGLAQLDNHTRAWTLEMDLTGFAERWYDGEMYDKYTVKIEWGYTEGGVLEKYRFELNTELDTDEFHITTSEIVFVTLSTGDGGGGGLRISLEPLSMLLALSSMALVIVVTRRRAADKK